MPEGTSVEIMTMKLSGGRKEHWVRIKCEGRSMETNVYSAELYNRALFERDSFRHVLLGAPKPNLRDKCYSDPKKP